MVTMQPCNHQVLFAISCKNVVKRHPILNASWVHNFKFQNSKLCEVIDLSLLILLILWGWTCKILRRDKFLFFFPFFFFYLYSKLNT